MTLWENNEAIERFREYLRIPSVHPNVDYEPCVSFLRKMSDLLGLPMSVHRCLPNKPVVIITWKGTQPHLPSIWLNSHMDVVPVFEEGWTYPPFSAHMDEEGKIFARGAQDMKSIGMQFIEAVRELKENGVVLKRTLHISFVPDEEVGGTEGMKLFVQSDAFRALNVGFALDEGMPAADRTFILFYGERCTWHFDITCTGQPGHALTMGTNTAAEKVRHVIDKFTDFRDEQRNPNRDPVDVTSVNLTILKGGVQYNVIPEAITLSYDMRVSVNQDHDELDKKIKGWCQESGEGIEIKFSQKDPLVKPTDITDKNPFWCSFKKATHELGITFNPIICPGTSDIRYLRQLGIPAFGFSALNNTPLKLHDHDEFVRADVYLRGIQIYKKIIENVANAP